MKDNKVEIAITADMKTGESNITFTGNSQNIMTALMSTLASLAVDQAFPGKEAHAITDFMVKFHTIVLANLEQKDKEKLHKKG